MFSNATRKRFLRSGQDGSETKQAARRRRGARVVTDVRAEVDNTQRVLKPETETKAHTQPRSRRRKSGPAPPPTALRIQDLGF